MERRSFMSLGAGVAAAALLGDSLPVASAQPSSSAQPVPPVLTQHDRTGALHTMGYSHLAYKVLTSDTQGSLFVIEHQMTRRGGPPLHVHPHQDEYFYVLEGDYTFVVGRKRVQLHTGDSVLAPRAIPHVWAFTGNGAGRMLISFTPAGRMEHFFNKVTSTHAPLQDAVLFRDHDMILLGPPLAV